MEMDSLIISRTDTSSSSGSTGSEQKTPSQPLSWDTREYSLADAVWGELSTPIISDTSRFGREFDHDNFCSCSSCMDYDLRLIAGTYSDADLVDSNFDLFDKEEEKMMEYFLPDLDDATLASINLGSTPTPTVDSALVGFSGRMGMFTSGASSGTLSVTSSSGAVSDPSTSSTISMVTPLSRRLSGSSSTSMPAVQLPSSFSSSSFTIPAAFSSNASRLGHQPIPPTNVSCSNSGGSMHLSNPLVNQHQVDYAFTKTPAFLTRTGTSTIGSGIPMGMDQRRYSFGHGSGSINPIMPFSTFFARTGTASKLSLSNIPRRFFHPLKMIPQFGSDMVSTQSPWFIEKNSSGVVGLGGFDMRRQASLRKHKRICQPPKHLSKKAKASGVAKIDTTLIVKSCSSRVAVMPTTSTIASTKAKSRRKITAMTTVSSGVVVKKRGRPRGKKKTGISQSRGRRTAVAAHGFYLTKDEKGRPLSLVDRLGLFKKAVTPVKPRPKN